MRHETGNSQRERRGLSVLSCPEDWQAYRCVIAALKRVMFSVITPFWTGFEGCTGDKSSRTIM